MNEANFRRDTCRLCCADDLELVLQLTPTPLADSYVPVERLDEVQQTYPLDLFLCRTCGHSQLLDVIHAEVIYCDYIYETASSLGLADHFKRYADELLHHVSSPKGSLVVDIGSNDGMLLNVLQSRGMRVLGVDPARDIARRATESGIETLPDFFTAELGKKIRYERGPAAIVTSNNLVANIDDLVGFIEGVRELLAPDGVFVFESFYLVDLIHNMVFDFIYHEHLSYFSVKPVEAFFRHNGMELIDVQRVATKGGSLRYTVQLTGGRRKVSPSVTDLIAFEESFGVTRADTFKAFGTKIDAAKNQLLSVLSELKVQGKVIYGYGASATTTTLIYHFQLGDVLSCILDDYPSKQNLFSPGLHIPVLSPQIIHERRPDYVLILAWRYSEPIIKNQRAYLAQGGHFIVPVPKIHVI